MFSIETFKSGALIAGTFAAAAFALEAQAAVVPQSALISSSSYYTDDIGGNIVTTGGDNAANVGLSSGRNDDGFMALNLGFSVSFFGNTYTSLYINNNGNVSFNNGIAEYIPNGPTGAAAPIISVFFGDVDTRASASGVVHYRKDADQLIVTWDRVGYFFDGVARADKLNSFQLVLRGDNYLIPAGEGAIGFFYKNMGWGETRDSDLEPLSAAAIGFGDGAGNSEVLEGSNTTSLFAAVSNKHIWFDPNLAPVPPVANAVPEPGLFGLMGLGLAGLAIGRRRTAVN
ncbi:MAG TPA: PEP-CTERM sorting domain-containing protein [Zoogloea sp.]|nr:PEP-CTERM sorting domain-containing protein [Zoogloea sp.]